MRLFPKESLTPKIALFFIASVIKIVAAAFAAVATVKLDPLLSIFSMGIWILWFVLFFLMISPKTNRLLKNQLNWMHTASKTIIIVLITATILELGLLGIINTGYFQDYQDEHPNDSFTSLVAAVDRVSYYGDAAALSHQAVENLLDGTNPYTQSNIITAANTYGVPYYKLTPRVEGQFINDLPFPETDKIEEVWLEVSETPNVAPIEFESNLNYPAAIFLVPAPFIWAGIDDLRITYILLVIPVLFFVVRLIPAGVRFYLVAALFSSLELWNSLAASDTGFLAFIFLLPAWSFRKRNLWLSAVFFAIAISIKQIAWFFIPFYLILVLRELGWKKVLQVSFIIGGGFLLINLPFILDDPKLWLESILGPMTDNLFPMGIGVVSLVFNGVVSADTSLTFTIMEIVVGVAAIIWFYFNCRCYPHAGLLLAVIPLFFAWRSGWSYFFYIDIIALASITLNNNDFIGGKLMPSPPVINQVIPRSSS